jgi:hypothetical protein
MEWRRKELVESRLRVGMIFYGRRFSRRELRKEGLVLRTLPYRASGYGEPRSGRSEDDHPDREGRPMLRELRAALH